MNKGKIIVDELLRIKEKEERKMFLRLKRKRKSRRKAKLKLPEYVLYSQVTNSIESAGEFCRMNAVKPSLIIVVWEEEYKEEK